MKATNNLSIFFTISMLCTFCHGQEFAVIQDTIAHELYAVEGSAENGFDFFASEELLQMTLCFDIRDFLRTKKEQLYYDAILTVKLNETDSISQHIMLRARGEMRRTYCSFPPIILRFTDNEHETEPIQINGKLKLVTHCKQIPVYKTYLFKEYLAYRLYNLVTPYSFKTRLVKINYVDIGGSAKAYSAYGFLLESEDKMAERNHAMIISNLYILRILGRSIDLARVAVFNYMIGNTDWSLESAHNVKILMTNEKLSFNAIPVAYDFDYSGFVNTDYSVPPEGLPIENVRERYYQGQCFGNDELKPVMDEFAGLKKQFMSTINDFDYLSNGYKKEIRSYINSFYETFHHQNYLMYDLSCASKND